MVYKTDEGKFCLKGIELTTIDRPRGNKKWHFQDARKGMMQTLMKWTKEHFQMDKELIDLAEPFIKLCANADDVKKFTKYSLQISV